MGRRNRSGLSGPADWGPASVAAPLLVCSLRCGSEVGECVQECFAGCDFWFPGFAWDQVADVDRFGPAGQLTLLVLVLRLAVEGVFEDAGDDLVHLLVLGRQ